MTKMNVVTCNSCKIYFK